MFLLKNYSNFGVLGMMGLFDRRIGVGSFTSFVASAIIIVITAGMGVLMLGSFGFNFNNVRNMLLKSNV